MAIEIEKKYRLSEGQKNYVSEALKDLQAEDRGEDFEENTIYGGGILDEKDAVLRLRRVGGKTVLTFKQRIEHESAVKHQIEHETEIADAEEMQKIIESLGFVPRLVYEKRRRTWTFKEVEIVLDELPFGSFMEIEGPADAIDEAERLLKIKDFTTEHETYPRLTRQLGKRNGELIEARF
jgi:adenylate cyclase, class 2